MQNRGGGSCPRVLSPSTSLLPDVTSFSFGFLPLAQEVLSDSSRHTTMSLSPLSVRLIKMWSGTIAFLLDEHFLPWLFQVDNVVVVGGDDNDVFLIREDLGGKTNPSA